MQETPTANQAESQAFVDRRHPLGVREPTEYDKMITDLLKHITTLNTGLLAIIAFRLPRSPAPHVDPRVPHPAGKTARFRPKENYHV